MKTIKNRKFILAPKFVWALMLILLVSSMIGTTVWAKPDKPGKPSRPEPETADFNIWIGEVDEDIILDSPSHFSVEDVVGGYWLPSPTKGKAPKGMTWRIDLISVEGDDCVTYTIADVLGVTPYEEKRLSVILSNHGIDVTTPAIFFSIEHVQKRSPYGGVSDYWQISIAWQVEVPGTQMLQTHGIICLTDMDAGLEGVYDSGDDVWTVTFDNAEAGLLENLDEGGRDMFVLWEGTLSFIVTITRTNVVT